ncbi:MAG: hypothetical protein KKB90_12185 [Actinobacteria bacterium]|nr:hypothetical protein [Actinomycetota bacterium]MCG2819054.1 hypothetical protein [Actinomycetes bacterium]MBU4219704.1 hypothetical protein [Actinomycetota bacterium]MBU4357687.1 hypothetical protein [Actinomycetota bacterium]MBU4391947.1 hypothetical protein [Actinomycetota bacterium]
MSEKKRIEDMTAREALELFEKGKKVRVAPPRKKDRMSVYNLRLKNETIDGLAKLAQKKGVPPSAVARQILEDGISQELNRLEQITAKLESVLVKYEKTFGA